MISNFLLGSNQTCFQAALREAHEEAVQKSLAAFDSAAVGVGPARKKFEGTLHKFFKKAFEVSYQPTR